MVAQSAPHANALSYARIDPHSGQMVDYLPHAANRASHKAYLIAAALHYGWIGAIAGQLLLLLGALAVPVLAWTGVASFLRGRRPATATRQRLVVVRKAVEADGVCSFELADPGGGRLPRFSAGSHIEVFLPGGLVRHYSLCNDPRERHRYLIAVMHVPESRGGSRAMHEAVLEGGAIETGLPRNHFPLVSKARRTILFAGGIGITPIICMAERLAGSDFALHYFARSPGRAAFRERIARSRFADRVQFHFSEGGRRVDVASLLPAPDSGTHLYVCGPAPFMDAVIDAARANGWSNDQVHREYFAAAPVDNTADTAFDIRIASSGAIVHVDKGVTALAALAAHGIKVPSSCEQGVCGTCVTRVTAGEPDHRDLFLSPEQRACNDQFAPCCSRSRSAILTLDL
jgi:vanillate O-demethylase ferredoxin subunit